MTPHLLSWVKTWLLYSLASVEISRVVWSRCLGFLRTVGIFVGEEKKLGSVGKRKIAPKAGCAFSKMKFKILLCLLLTFFAVSIFAGKMFKVYFENVLFILFLHNIVLL